MITAHTADVVAALPKRRLERVSKPRELVASSLGEFLDDVEQRLSGSDVALATAALDELFRALHATRENGDSATWREVVAACRQHSLHALLRQDPLTARAFQKPRGYAGDACMMDFIYDVEDGRKSFETTPVGRAVHDYIIAGPACSGVRSRRATIAASIDRLAERRAKPRILSLAAGHLREANLSAAIRRQRFGRLLAVDADAASLAEVSTCYGGLGVETLTASFTALFKNQEWEGHFDLVYATGLFDYLGPRVGRRLVSAMHRMLAPRGTLLVANFLPGVLDTGYMEAFMDWELVYRSRKDMVDLTSEIPESEVENVALWSEEALNIIFLRLTRS